jgi:hypothetical protein
VLFGTCTQLPAADKDAALGLITEALLPGRTGEIRRPTERELNATLVLEFPIVEWSLKVSENWPEDEADDIAGDAWAGVVPLVSDYAAALPAPDLRAGIPLPASVSRLGGSAGRPARS